MSSTSVGSGVRRVPEPEDGRSTLVELTGDGHALVRRVRPAQLETERRIVGVLEVAEREALAHLLKKLLLSFEEQEAERTSLTPGQPPPRRPRGGTRAGRGPRRRPA